MYWTYLRRELAGRKKQTIIVAVGLAVAIALVIVVNALSAGVRDAQAQALESVYGVGTDLTVTGAAAEPGEGGGQRFEFDSEAGETTDGTTSVSQSRLTADFMRGTLDASTVESVASLDGVAAASGALSLTNITFSGEMPDRSQMQQGGPGESGEPPAGGPDGAGGSGPLSAVEVSEGRALAAGDAGELVAVVDASYATTNEISVGDTIDVGGSEVEVVGLIASTSSDADTAANVYIPLDVAQSLAGLDDVVSTVYVQATSANQIDAVQAEIEDSVAGATVSSQSDLASTVSSSLASASSLITNLGTWLSILVLAVALALAVLFTISGVTRRTREFGTLKAIGWSNGRVVGQVAGESVIQGLIGGAIGLAVGLAGIWIINLISPTISSTAASTGQAGPGQGGGPMGGGFGGMAQQAADIVLHAPITLWVVAAAVGIAIAGGLIAGAFGGWRAARLSPAEALRSVG